MTQIIAPTDEAVSTAVEFTVAKDKGTLQMDADPGASGEFVIKLLGYPDTTILTLSTSSDATVDELTLNPGTFTATKTASSNSCGLDCNGLHVSCVNPG